jgi:hypothetical protein
MRYAARESNLDNLAKILDVIGDIEHGIIVRLNNNTEDSNDNTSSY